MLNKNQNLVEHNLIPYRKKKPVIKLHNRDSRSEAWVSIMGYFVQIHVAMEYFCKLLWMLALMVSRYTRLNHFYLDKTHSSMRTVLKKSLLVLFFLPHKVLTHFCFFFLSSDIWRCSERLSILHSLSVHRSNASV